MKTIKPNELFQHLGGFLKAKGIEFTDGVYAERIRKGCNLLSDAVNATQKTVRHAKVEVDKKLDQLRQTIHDATAPKPPQASPAPDSAPPSKPAENKSQARPRAAKVKATGLRARKRGDAPRRSPRKQR